MGSNVEAKSRYHEIEKEQNQPGGEKQFTIDWDLRAIEENMEDMNDFNQETKVD